MKNKYFKVKAVEDESNDSGISFEGFLAVYGNEDRDGDVIEQGAFTESIKNKSTVPLCFNHNRGQVLGRLDLEDRSEGVFVKGFMNLNDPFSANIFELIKMKALDSLSIGMRISDFDPLDPKQPFGGWLIKIAECVEGSIATVPSNEQALIAATKALNDKEREELNSLRVEKKIAKTVELLNKAKDRL